MSDLQLIIEDNELVSRAGRGDKLAFGVLYERYLDLILRYIYYRVANIADAEDLTEQVFFKVWENLPHPDKGKQIMYFRAWIYRIAHNLVVDYHRAGKGWLTYNESALAGEIDDKDPESIIEINQQNRALANAISSLDPQMQQVVIHRFVHGYSHAETAEIIGLKENHVRVIQHRALKKLKNFLTG